MVQIEKLLDLCTSSGPASQCGCVVMSFVVSYKTIKQGMCFGYVGCGAERQCIVTEVNAEHPVFLCPWARRLT